MERLTKHCPLGAYKADYTISWKQICEKLAYYEDLEEQGLLLKLPFTLGQTIYWITTKCAANLEEDNACLKYECNECQYDKELTIVEGAANKYHIVSFLEGTLDRQYFLSKEEAEKALKEMEKKNE